MMSGGGFLHLVSLFISFRTSACQSLGIVILLSVAKPSVSTFAACFPVYVFPFPSITVHPLCVVSFSSFSDFVSFQSFVGSFSRFSNSVFSFQLSRIGLKFSFL